ncbi:hypothetical protein [Mucilaginibacter polytrichastri]|uniref:Uncharacterized protein n=1 Tax=Mucilaginibacter polytrichastri TaxID=1302689 RepID=A0A1Q6A2Z4_9SPHI|nr:hypothetical protein [Mucilaginibacter polytrichastri]OKS88387.1 hypothetical protein RG47T_3854 [Mucilaginibacter polytrichastri]SFT14210.1 hypothetical protein SAMN04487890_112118 [Mucilaginibacter polytrichastri]
MIFKRTALKLSTIILLVSLILITIGLFASNMALKTAYNKLDKNDKYWNFNTVLRQPFKHLKIEGGNITQIVFEQAPTSALRIAKYWTGYKNESNFKAYVSKDTLHITMVYNPKSGANREWMSNTSLIRISAPQLLSVNINNTNFEWDDLKQNSLNVNMRGKSGFRVESMVSNIDTLKIIQRDSTMAIFDFSSGYKGPRALNFQHINADLYNRATLNIGAGFANDLKLNMGDSCSVILSGKSVSKLHK